MPDWDEDSPQLRENLAHVLGEIARSSEKRKIPTLEAARQWHILAMKDLDVPDPRYVGAFRGEPGLENTQVKVGLHYGVASGEVTEALLQFEAKLQRLVKELDRLAPPAKNSTATVSKPPLIYVRGYMPSGCESIHLLMETAARRAFGPTASRCVMACRLLCGFARGRMPATNPRAQGQWRASGKQLQRCFGNC